MKPIIQMAIAAVLTASPAFAEEVHRELGPHEHGHGTLSIAVENSRISMELEVPGMDVVGFEHAAESTDQKAKVEIAKDQLKQPLTLFKLPEAAGCKVADAKVAIETEHEHEDGDKHDDHAKDDDHAKGDHDEREGHEGHNEFHVAYTLDCANPAALTSINFEYFKAFAGANKLTVNVVTPKAQNTYEVTRDKPALDLGGMM